MVDIVEVKTKKQLKLFVEYVNKLYWDCEYFVPMLFNDEMNNFTPKKNPAYEEAEVVLYLAYRGDEIVGRIAGIIQHTYNKKMNCKKVRFTRFDCIDDQEVANALFDSVSKWAKAKGMTDIIGPLGFNDLDREGLLIKGFDRIVTYESQYNYDYYPKLIENYGFTKDVDWVEYRVKWVDKLDERYERIGNKILEKYKLKVVHVGKRELINKYGNAIFDLCDEGYKDLYGTVPLTPKVRKMMLKNFGLAVNPRLVCVIVDEHDKAVAFALTFPSMSEAIRDSHGKLLPLGVFRLLHAVKRPKVIDFGLISISNEYKNKGLNSIIFSEIVNNTREYGIEACETNLNLEYNLPVQNMWRNYEKEQHRRRRSYIKHID